MPDSTLSTPTRETAPLQDVPEIHRRIEARTLVGKVVLVP